MREFIRRHRSILLNGVLSLLIIGGISGLTLAGLEKKNDVDCLYQTVDRAWDNWALWKKVPDDVMRRQIEAITRIEIARAQRERRSFCPQGKRFEWSYDSITHHVSEQWKGYWESGSSSERYRLVYPIVAKGLALSWYAHEWPLHFRCNVPEYKATRMRIPPWVYDRSYKEVGAIGNLTVYCKREEVAKSQ